LAQNPSPILAGDARALLRAD
jgi:predicted DNA-binding transcriptional regulator YafY